MQDHYFETVPAAWKKLLQDAKVEDFPLTSVGDSSCVVGGCVGKTAHNGERRRTPGFGTIIVRRSKSDFAGQYAAIQFHPPHFGLHGDAARLWHFHVRAVEVIDTVDGRDVFQISDHLDSVWYRYVRPSSNSALAGCAKYYFIDPSTRTKEDNPSDDSIE